MNTPQFYVIYTLPPLLTLLTFISVLTKSGQCILTGTQDTIMAVCHTCWFREINWLLSLFVLTLLSDVRSPCHIPYGISYVWRWGKLFHNLPHLPAHSSHTSIAFNFSLLYSGYWSRKSRAILLLPLWAVWPVQSLSACTRVHFTFTFTFLFI